jgi:hypothetical protein
MVTASITSFRPPNQDRVSDGLKRARIAISTGPTAASRCPRTNSSTSASTMRWT